MRKKEYKCYLYLMNALLAEQVKTMFNATLSLIILRLQFNPTIPSLVQIVLKEIYQRNLFYIPLNTYLNTEFDRGKFLSG